MPRIRSDLVTVICLALGLGLAGCAARAPDRTAAPGADSAASPAPMTSSPAPAADPSELRGITWLMTSAVVDGKTVAVPGAFEGNGGLTLTIGDGTLGGYDGCNWFSGSATEVSGTITPKDGDTMTTARGCSPGSRLTDAYTGFLRSPFPWTIGSGALRIGSDGATHFDFVPFPEGFPSELAGESYPTIAEGTDGGLRYRIYLSRNTPGQDLCLSMEFRNEPGQNQQPVFACRSTDTARQYVVNPTDFHSSSIEDRGLVLSAVPSGTATRIVVKQKSGESMELTLTPVSGTDYVAFHGFIPDPQRGDSVLFYDGNGKQIDPTWEPYW